MRFIVALVGVAVFTLASHDARAAHPSFDCAMAVQPSERTVCNSDLLAALDNIVTRGYRHLKALRGPDVADAIAGPYLAKRNRCGTSEECIGELYFQEIHDFRDSSWQIDDADQVPVATQETAAPASPVNETPPSALARQFYRALSAGDGVQASELIVPERREGPFSAAAMTEFYSRHVEKMRVLSVEPMSENSALAQYTFVSNAGVCDGRSIVTTQTRPYGVFISAIKALNGC